MHLGRNNHKYEYAIASSGTNTTLGETTNERSLGVQVDPELKFDQHVELIANKASRMLGLIRRAGAGLVVSDTEDSETSSSSISSLSSSNMVPSSASTSEEDTDDDGDINARRYQTPSGTQTGTFGPKSTKTGQNKKRYLLLTAGFVWRML
ncbi:hypothetical protein LSAT2_005111 [Lamellibrachia satsuma]|nr:hypothetical protein LSAT2_005111 [Lamellibrachia satsuma]